MRYLKSFNEGQFYTIGNVLYTFAQDNLAYLLDEDNMNMKVFHDTRLSDSGSFNWYEFSLYNAYGFKWDDIKDHFIPFLQRLQKLDYIDIRPYGSVAAGSNEIRVFRTDLNRDFLAPTTRVSDYCLLEDVINDNCDILDGEITKICFHIKQLS
jgi:hypothetical protein